VWKKYSLDFVAIAVCGMERSKSAHSRRSLLSYGNPPTRSDQDVMSPSAVGDIMEQSCRTFGMSSIAMFFMTSRMHASSCADWGVNFSG